MAFGVNVKLDEDGINKVKQDFNKFVKELQEVSNKNVIDIKVNNAVKDINNINNRLKGISNTAKTSSNEFKTLGSSISSITGFFLKWTGVVQTLNFAMGQLKGGIQEVIDLNRANVNIAMITNQSVANVEKMNRGFLEMAKSLKVVNSEVVSGAEAWLRSGADMETANKNLTTTVKLAKIAGSSTDEMGQSLVTISEAYDMNSKSLEEYSSKVALLDNQSASSSKKINDAMTYASEAFKDAKIDMDTALSMITNYSQKSSMSGRSIGDGFRSFLTNFHKMQQGIKDGDEEQIQAVNKLETLLNRKNIALRKSKDEWVNIGDVIKNVQQNLDKFSEVELSDVAFQMGGKEQSAIVLSTLKNMKEIERFNTALKNDNGAKALNDSYSKYLDSIDAKMANLKNASTELWMDIINANGIKTAVGGLTTFVKYLDIIATSSANTKVAIGGLTVAIVAMGIAIKKNSIDALNTSIIGLIPNISKAIMSGQALTSALGGLKAGFALLLSPVSTIAVILGVATYAFTKHLQKQKEIKEQTDLLASSYKNLSQAIKDNDVTAMESNSKSLGDAQAKLQQALKTKAETEKRMSEIMALQAEAEKNHVPVVGDYAKEQQKLITNNKEATKTIAEVTKELNGAGISYDSVTGEIYSYTDAITRINHSKIASEIKATAEQEYNHKQEIIGLIQEYQQLNSIENKNEVQRQRMSQISEQLQGTINGLNVVRDAEGNLVITNTKLINDEIGTLTREGDSLQTLTNVKLTNAKQSAEIEIGKTKVTYAECKKRIEMYKAESLALQQEINDSIASGGVGVAEAFSMKAKTEDWIKQYQSAVDTLDKIYAVETPKITTNLNNGSGGGGYIAPNKEEKEKEKKIIESNIEASRTYSSIIEGQNDSLQNQNDIIEGISKNVDKLENEKQYQEAINESNKLLEAQNTKKSMLENNKNQLVDTKSKIEQDFKANSWFTDGQDISSLTKEQLSQARDAMFAGNKTFATEEEKASFDNNFKTFDNLVSELFKVKDAINANDKEQLKLNEDIDKGADNVKKINEAWSHSNFQKDEDEYNSQIKSINDQIEQAEIDAKSIDDNDTKAKLANEEKITDLQNKKLTVMEDYKASLIATTDGTDKYKTAIEGVTDAMRTQNGVIADNKNASEDLVKEKVKELIEKEKEAEIAKLNNDQNDELVAIKEKQKQVTEKLRDIENEVSDIMSDTYDKEKESFSIYLDGIDAEIKAIKEKASVEQEEVVKTALLKQVGILEAKKAYETEKNSIKGVIDGYDSQIKALNKQADVQDEINERLEKQANLTKLQKELENIKNNKNVQTLKQQADGSWQYEYTYDEAAYNEKNDELQKSTIEFQEWESDNTRKHQIESLQTAREAKEKELKLLEDNFSDQQRLAEREYSKMLSQVDTYFDNMTNKTNAKYIGLRTDVENKYKDIDVLTNERLIALKGTFNNNLDAILTDVTEKTKKINEKIEAMTLAYNKANALGGFVGGSGGSALTGGTNTNAPTTTSGNGSNILGAAYNAGVTAVNTVTSWFKNIASAEDGGQTPNFSGGRLMMLHANEKISTADDTKKLDIILDSLPDAMKVMSSLSTTSLIKPVQYSAPNINPINREQSVVNHYTFGDLSLPNVKDANDFRKGLKDLAFYAMNHEYKYNY